MKKKWEGTCDTLRQHRAIEKRGNPAQNRVRYLTNSRRVEPVKILKPGRMGGGVNRLELGGYWGRECPAKGSDQRQEAGVNRREGGEKKLLKGKSSKEEERTTKKKVCTGKGNT